MTIMEAPDYLLADDTESRAVRALGAPPRPVAGIRWVTKPNERAAMVAVLGPVDAVELDAALDAAEDWAIPVADFAGNPGIRRDFAANGLDAGSFAAACRTFQPIWRRLAAMPFDASRGERAEMAILRLAWSRDVAIEASCEAGLKWVVGYKLLGVSAANQERLESLATMSVLRRRHYMRTHTCLRCTSARLLAYEACPGCGGGDLADERVVHHYRCGAQEAESHFIRGRRLVCPKCRRDLRHFGMDYGKSGTIVHCRTCGASHGEPDPRFNCLDCGNAMPAAKAAQTDWYHYDLTEAGIQALRDGKLPVIASELDRAHRPHGRSLREFTLLATAAQHSARRFGRPFTVVEFSSPVAEALRDTYSDAAIRLALRQALATVVETIPESDFAALTERSTILVGFPETTEVEAERIVSGLRPAIAAKVALPLELAPVTYAGDAIADLLSRP